MNAYLSLFFMLMAMAASAQNRPQPTYTSDWKRADSLAAKGLPKSSLAIANRIYKEAKVAHNYPQVAKAAMARMIFRTYSDEDAYVELINSLQRDIAETPEPAKSVLQSVQADIYWRYFQQNRYKFYNRTTVGQMVKGTGKGGKTKPNATAGDSEKSADTTADFRTWDAPHLVEAITKGYMESLKDKELLRKTPIAAYDALLDKGDADARLLRPTLYDLLAHRAIDFFQNTEPDLLKPVFKFDLDQASYLASPDVFAGLVIQSRDSLSGRFQALKLYQQLLQFHLSDANPNALADVDGLRLQFVYRNSVVPTKDSLYRQTLDKQIARYKNQPAEAAYGFQLASFLTNMDGNVRPLDEDAPDTDRPDPLRWHNKQAADICRDLIRRFPETLAARQADQLLNRLTKPSYSLEVEHVNIANQPFRALVNYQNIGKLRYRLIRMSVAELQTYWSRANSNGDQPNPFFKTMVKRPSVREESVALPNDGDLNRHSVEIPLSGLPLGQYLLLATNEEKFQLDSEFLQHTAFTVSDLGYVASMGTGADELLFVTNRITGEPIKKASVTLVNNQALTTLNSFTTAQTDADGRLKIPASAMPAQVTFQYLIAVGQDTLLSGAQGYYRNNNREEEERPQTYTKLFTDRAIYRPGQLIYVKGLLYEGKTNQFSVVADQEVAIELLDQNGERVAKQTFRTNEFGTFSATFTAPVGRLTGTMSLQTSQGGTSIRVEEYKRPTFEVKANPIKQSFKLGSTVTVTALAKTFSGAVVDGAAVRYRVTRRLRQRWYWWYNARNGGGYRNTSQSEIANGTAQTDAQGALQITFAATPDLNQSRQDNPVFEFDITIDVTDKAGETRSATQTLAIGYSALQISLAIPEQIEKTKSVSFPVKITNQSNEKVLAKGQLTVYRLQPPSRLLRNRLWNRPDRQLLSRAEFEKLFPNDVYANEIDPRTWPKGEVVQQQVINAPADSLIKPDMSRYTPGEYVAEVTVVDSSGETIKERAFFTVVDDNQPMASAQPDRWVQVRKATAEPGEEAIFWVGTRQPGWVLMTVEENRKVVRQEWLKTEGKPRRVTLPVTEKQRGGFAVHFAMIQNGRLYQESQLVTVPFTNKQLTIETKTFRNKLKPGEREEWTLAISGLDKKPAELVATLYDASLDAFDRLDWPTSFYQSYQTNFYGWQTNSFNAQGSSALFYRYRPEPPVPIRRYDELKWLRGNTIIRLRGNMPEMAVAKMASRAMAPAALNYEAKSIESAAADRAVPVETQSLASPASASPIINPRRNVNETAFFIPQAQTDNEGRVILKFTMPEALTRWRLLAFAHTKDLKTGTLEREIITQKELMITANAPRFLREGDTIRLMARVNNLSEKSLSVLASLSLLDALTGEPINQKLTKASLQSTVSIAPGAGQAVGWTLVVPTGLDAVTCRLTAQSGLFTDGEEFTIPVLPNRMLVTDTKPFWVNGSGSKVTETKEFTLKELANRSPELPVQHERLTVEVTSNPSWYALQSLPYLMEYQYECAEQLFSRLYANSLAAYIVNSKPAFRQVIAEWQKTPPTSPLQTNSELKAVVLENSPWLADARSEADRQAKLGQLLDANRMEREQLQAFEKLKQLQTGGNPAGGTPAGNGGFRWFGGMEPNLAMTLHILSGFGHLQKLGVTFPTEIQADLAAMKAQAIQFADAEIKQWVNEQKKINEQKTGKIASPWYFSATQYLYARSFYPNIPIDKAVLAYLKQKVATDWLSQSLQGQSLAAMALNRFGDTKTADGILRSLRERARESEELGMYWPENQSGLYWYQAPIETQAYLIEAFDEIKQDRASVDAMKRWLLRQKQTQSWSSTKATTEAVYALLLRGSDWLSTGTNTHVSLGGQPIDSRVTKSDAITGYQKVTYAASEIKPEMGIVRITKTGDGPAWGALYWQHFEPLDQVMPGSAGLSVQKTLYVQHDSPGGPVITPVSSASAIKPGDLIKVRLVLKTDRAMEYVHLKDGRASGFEPVAALSGYNYRNGLGYYEAPRDASTDFFMSYLPVGTHVFEYELRVAQTGDFSAGVATVQCFYAPEFSAHSAGERVKVK